MEDIGRPPTQPERRSIYGAPNSLTENCRKHSRYTQIANLHGFWGRFPHYGIVIAQDHADRLPMIKNNHVLLVEGDRDRLHGLQRILATRGQVDAYETFAHARRRLLLCRPPPQLLVTNGRLGPYNGIHLAYLAATLALPTRVVVYDSADRLTLAREAQRAGAFFVRGSHLTAALPRYLEADLPTWDRRNVGSPNRRQVFRGGRRATDAKADSLDVGDTE